MQLARLALEAALATPGVVSGSEGRLRSWVTIENGQRLPGVVAAEQADGLVGVTLHLVVEPVPLHPLADGLRSRIEAGTAASSLAGRLGPIDISFEDLGEPGAVPAVVPPVAPPPGTAAATPPASGVAPTPPAQPAGVGGLDPSPTVVAPGAGPTVVPPGTTVVRPATTVSPAADVAVPSTPAVVPPSAPGVAPAAPPAVPPGSGAS